MSKWKGEITWKSKSSFYWSEHKTRWLLVNQKIQWVLQNTMPESAGWTVVKSISVDKLKTRIKDLKTGEVHLVSKTSDVFYFFLREDDWLGPVVILRKHFNSNKKERIKIHIFNPRVIIMANAEKVRFWNNCYHMKGFSFQIFFQLFPEMSYSRWRQFSGTWWVHDKKKQLHKPFQLM